MLKPAIEITYLTPDHPDYPPALTSSRIYEPPPRISAIGSLEVLKERKTALFCSQKCPGSVIIKNFDYVREQRDKGTIFISGFHSPVEKECLDILMRGKQPIIICPARGLEGMRIPKEWRKMIREGRLLLLSPFSESEKRLRKDLAMRRNLFAASVAEEILVGYAVKGSRTQELVKTIQLWNKKVTLIENEI